MATASAFAFFVLATAPAYAAGSNMPWEQPLTRILDSINRYPEGDFPDAASRLINAERRTQFEGW